MFAEEKSAAGEAHKRQKDKWTSLTPLKRARCADNQAVFVNLPVDEAPRFGHIYLSIHPSRHKVDRPLGDGDEKDCVVVAKRRRLRGANHPYGIAPLKTAGFTHYCRDPKHVSPPTPGLGFKGETKSIPMCASHCLALQRRAYLVTIPKPSLPFSRTVTHFLQEKPTYVAANGRTLPDRLTSILELVIKWLLTVVPSQPPFDGIDIRYHYQLQLLTCQSGSKNRA